MEPVGVLKQPTLVTFDESVKESGSDILNVELATHRFPSVIVQV